MSPTLGVVDSVRAGSRFWNGPFGSIHDTDVATAFAIEAVALVDHLEFLDRLSQKGKTKKKPPSSKQQAAVLAKWFLTVGDGWTKPFYDSNDLRSVDRELFGG